MKLFKSQRKYQENVNSSAASYKSYRTNRQGELLYWPEVKKTPEGPGAAAMTEQRQNCPPAN